MSDRIIEPPRIRVVIGSRALLRSKAEGWARLMIDRWFDHGGRGGVFVSGAANGPDRWGADAAASREARVLEYRLDGFRWCNGVRCQSRWTSDPTPSHGAGVDAWRRWCLGRDTAMVMDLCHEIQAGCSIEALALIARWSRTQGTAYTADLMAECGMRPEIHYSPADLSPSNS